MLSWLRLAASAAALASLGFTTTALAASPPHGGGMGAPHVGGSGHTFGLHGGMPAHGFHGSPPGFHSTLSHGGPSSGGRAAHHEFGRPGHDLGTFHGHDFAHFTAQERASWQGGAWHHAWHNGHYGWWWFADGFWFFYPEPIYPFPLYVGALNYYDYYDQYGAPAYYWYYCEDPAGYYPYVQQCSAPWQQVPPTADSP